MSTVQLSCANCGSALEYGGRGRPPKYCTRRCKAAAQHAINGNKPCSLNGCGKARYQGRSLCATHAMRKHRYGDSSESHDRTGRPWINSAGYIKRGLPGHLLADKQGAVYEHRAVLLDKIGPGTHPCNWCGTSVTWMDDLEVDHVNHVRDDNTADNLVPSCHSCNTRRALDRRWSKPRT